MYLLKWIPVKFGKPIWGVLVFVFLFKLFPKAVVLIQITFLYSCSLQKFDLLLFDVELSRTLNGAFIFTFSNTLKTGKSTPVHISIIKEKVHYSLKCYCSMNTSSLEKRSPLTVTGGLNCNKCIIWQIWISRVSSSNIHVMLKCF